MKRVVIVGIGFAGLHAARALAGRGLEVVVVDRENFHLFQPLLYQVATAGLEQESIAYPARAIIRHREHVSFRLNEVCGIDFDRREILTPDGPIGYDYAVIAPGSITNFFGMENIRRLSYDLKRLDEATDLRSQILSCFEKGERESDPARRRMLLTFVIVGGGPTGVEFAGALAELIHFVLARDYPGIHTPDCRIVLIELDRLLKTLPERLQKYAHRKLTEMGVEVVLGRRVVDAQPDRVFLDDGSSIDAATLFWSSGVRGAPLTDAIDCRKGPQGRIVVLPDLTIPGHPDVYVAGDAAYLEQDGEGLPMVAPVAMQQGDYVGKAILARQRGDVIPPFRYRDKGTMATIGRSAAVAQIGKAGFSGFMAWVLWLGLHLFYLIGFRNRLLVLLNWSYYYFSHERQVRLITREGEGGKCG
ncbi:NAD(P)/FAD-dependent oxidoreductase [Geobacter sp. DSM 9736]|uniref:NAD(P)/FAD-dependent oxidoreductase n=1 Tax=Geobacter sp. DSM 9736 TaxID=1277350 RepID=UPI000B500AF0|nr:NAD(P)/FAD-dependent oxidoreductase [Geobacter sp. DSM 9736]SNB45210.1 NADH dehydrogenase [Geobacter sp. DSM 9736]